jgi:hypothetical protein
MHTGGNCRALWMVGRYDSSSVAGSHAIALRIRGGNTSSITMTPELPSVKGCEGDRRPVPHGDGTAIGFGLLNLGSFVYLGRGRCVCSAG